MFKCKTSLVLGHLMGTGPLENYPSLRMWFGLKAELQWGRFKMVLGTNCGGPGFWPCKDRCCVPWGSVHTPITSCWFCTHTPLLSRDDEEGQPRGSSWPLACAILLLLHPHKINRPHSRRTSCLCATSWEAASQMGDLQSSFPSSGLRRHHNFPLHSRHFWDNSHQVWLSV